MANWNRDTEPTRRSLLARLKNWDDQTSWLDFFNKYWRLIYRVARRAGLSEEEAQDIVQETILTVCKSMKTFEYQPERCSFRSWLRLLTRQRIMSLVRKKHRQAAVDAQAMDAALESLNTAAPPDSLLETIWSEEWSQHLIMMATEQVRKQVKAKQLQIYDLYVVQQWPAKRVAQALKVSLAQVYLAKHRVGRLMKKTIQDLSQS